MLREQDVGHRIVVRRRVGVRGGRPVYADALGELVELNETHLTLTTRQGRLRVPIAEVHRAKRVPAARRPTAAAMIELELAGPPAPAALDEVQRWYAGHGRPAMVNTPLPLRTVGGELDRRGWAAAHRWLVQTAPLAALLGRKGGLPDAARHVLTAVDHVRFAHVYLDGVLVAVGRGTVTGQGRWLGLCLVEVLPAARRQGLAVRLIRALADWPPRPVRRTRSSRSSRATPARSRSTASWASPPTTPI